MILMQFVDGGTLAAKIPLPLDVAIEVMMEVTEAVQCLHSAGILHRDIKPRNIGSTRQSELKLLDFGLARLEDEVTMSGVPGHTVVGTPAYMSPEALGRQRASPAFDLWSLAVVLYELLTSHRPYEAGTRQELTVAIQNAAHRPIEDRLPGCSTHLRGLFDSAFALDSAKRPSRADRWLVLLRSIRART